MSWTILIQVPKSGNTDCLERVQKRCACQMVGPTLASTILVGDSSAVPMKGSRNTFVQTTISWSRMLGFSSCMKGLDEHKLCHSLSRTLCSADRLWHHDSMPLSSVSACIRYTF